MYLNNNNNYFYEGIINYQRQIPDFWGVDDVEVTEITDGFEIEMIPRNCAHDLPLLSVAHAEVNNFRIIVLLYTSPGKGSIQVFICLIYLNKINVSTQSLELVCYEILGIQQKRNGRVSDYCQ